MSEQTAVSSIVRSLKRDPTGKGFCQLGADGVFRMFDSSYDVVDAARFSPAQIKAWLDKQPFDQRVEDKFRGVDGRGVSDEQVWNPRAEIRPKRLTEDEEREMLRKIEEQNGNLVKDGAACGMKKSDYNLDPR